MNLKPWQLAILAILPTSVVILLFGAASTQLHAWHLDWVWAIVFLVFLAWRILLSQWLQPLQLSETPTDTLALPADADQAALQQQALAQVKEILAASRKDLPPWLGWLQFWQRCQQIVVAIAGVYYPQLKRPLLQIYVPQAVGLMRNTVDDVDRWLQGLSPILEKVTVGQAYEAYEFYQTLQPTAKLAMQVWRWSQWILNPAVALARATTAGYGQQANQQLVANLGQIVREETLTALAHRAIQLYSGGQAVAPEVSTSLAAAPQVQTLRQILEQSQAPVEQKPVSLLLVGRTGAGKSSLINTLFVSRQAEVDVLPSTDKLQDYQWQSPSGDTLTLWDTPGYEQVGRPELRQAVLNQAKNADALLLVTPAMDPALQMDLDFLTQVQTTAPNLPILVAVTQIDQLRPLREWQPPYDWQQGQRPKEISMREAIVYRQEKLGEFCTTLLPLVTEDTEKNRLAWGVTPLATALVDLIDPAKQGRLARFINDLDTRTAIAAKIIDRYALQMGTAQGLTSLLKTPLLRFLSVWMTGSPALAMFLAERLPLEQSPVVLGKLQMAYELAGVFGKDGTNFDLLTLWPLLLDPAEPVTKAAWALGQALSEYWTGGEPSVTEDKTAKLQARYQFYLESWVAKV
jgi:predicted GTPase